MVGGATGAGGHFAALGGPMIRAERNAILAITVFVARAPDAAARLNASIALMLPNVAVFGLLFAIARLRKDGSAGKAKKGSGLAGLLLRIIAILSAALAVERLVLALCEYGTLPPPCPVDPGPDCRIAASRVLEARALQAAARALRLPQAIAAAAALLGFVSETDVPIAAGVPRDQSRRHGSRKPRPHPRCHRRSRRPAPGLHPGRRLRIGSSSPAALRALRHSAP